jgi:hypothetical protein
MDFLERYFHISPDGGSGMTEASYVVTAALVLFVLPYRGALRSAWRTCIKFFFRRFEPNERVTRL